MDPRGKFLLTPHFTGQEMEAGEAPRPIYTATLIRE